MISFNLRCDKDHEFQAWFASGAAFEKQREIMLLSCPVCASNKIEKSLMAPSVRTTKGREVVSPNQSDQDETVNAASKMPAEIVEAHEQMRELAQKVARELKKNSEDVGDRFADEARKVHLGESEERPIHGRATLEEAADLHEDGIDFIPLPDLPESKN